jgi:hypothetical protein
MQVQLSINATEMSPHELVGYVATGRLSIFVSRVRNNEMEKRLDEKINNFEEQIHALNIDEEDYSKIIYFKDAWENATIQQVEHVVYDILHILKIYYFRRLAVEPRRWGRWGHELFTIYKFLWKFGVKLLKTEKKLEDALLSGDFAV